MNRRKFLKKGAAGLAAVALNGYIGVPDYFRYKARAQTPLIKVQGPVQLTMEEVMHEMVDGLRVYHWAYRDPAGSMRIPGPALFALEGDTIRLSITNAFPPGHAGLHSFAIPGVVESGPIPVGQTAQIEFAAPAAGLYTYLDPVNRPVNRVMGLNGVLVVMPREGNSPYNNPTPAVQQLFNDLGALGWSPGKGSSDFPGHPWDPSRQWIWVFHSIDPVMNAEIRVNPNLPGDQFTRDFLPLYFTINGRSGVFSAHGEDIEPVGNVGQPALIRVVNTGMAHHSPHIHGNHVFVLAENNSFGRTDAASVPLTEELGLPQNSHIRDNVVLVDTWGMAPGDRKDVLLPFIVPPDIPIDRAINRNPAASPTGRASVLSPTGRAARGGNETPWPPVEEPFPLLYPMHCHNEISQTAAGNNYPQGLITHWGIEGGIDMRRVLDVRGLNRGQVIEQVPGLNGVITIDRADMRIELNKISLHGAFSGRRGTIIDLHAGPDPGTGPKIGGTVVQSDGTWSFRGRALAVIPSRQVSARALPHPSFSVETANEFSSVRRGIPLSFR